MLETLGIAGSSMPLLSVQASTALHSIKQMPLLDILEQRLIVKCTIAGLLTCVKVLARTRSQRLLARVMVWVVIHRNRPDVAAAVLQQASKFCKFCKICAQS